MSKIWNIQQDRNFGFLQGWEGLASRTMAEMREFSNVLSLAFRRFSYFLMLFCCGVLSVLFRTHGATDCREWKMRWRSTGSTSIWRGLHPSLHVQSIRHNVQSCAKTVWQCESRVRQNGALYLFSMCSVWANPSWALCDRDGNLFEQHCLWSLWHLRLCKSCKVRYV